MRSTDCEQFCLSLTTSGEETISVFSLLLQAGYTVNPWKLDDVLRFLSSDYLMGDSSALLACFSFFSHYCRSKASTRFYDFSFSSSALSSLLDLRSSLTVPMHSMILLAYSWLEALLSSSSLSMDLKFSIWMRAISSSFLSFSFSALSSMISLALESMLMLTWFLIRPALTAYWRVESVSSRQSWWGLRQAMRQVRQLPPKAFLRMEVSLESRQGMYCSFPLPIISSRERITFLRKKRDLLISMASLLSRPTGLNTLSDPARSTKQAFRTRQLCCSSSSSMRTMKMEWEREEQSWILLLATTLFLLPWVHALSMSADCAHSFSVRSSITNSRSISHRILRPLSLLKSAVSMSLILSLQICTKEHFMTAEEALLPQMSATAAWMMPWLLPSPSKAKVLPEPVWPQVRMVVLYPSMNLPISWLSWQFLQMDSLVEDAS